VIDGFIGDFKGRPEFGQAVAKIMETYEMKVFYRSIRGETMPRDWVQPVVTWEKVTAAVPEFFCDDAGLYYFIGVCYYQMEEYDVATVYLHSVAYNWPDEKLGKDAKAFIKDQPEKLK